MRTHVHLHVCARMCICTHVLICTVRALSALPAAHADCRPLLSPFDPAPPYFPAVAHMNARPYDTRLMHDLIVHAPVMHALNTPPVGAPFCDTHPFGACLNTPLLQVLATVQLHNFVQV